MLKLVPRAQLPELVATGCGLAADMAQVDLPSDPVIAEYLRATICHLSQDGAGGTSSAVYVTRLTNGVRRQLSSVWPQLERGRVLRPSVLEQDTEGDIAPDPIRRVLEALSDLREVQHVGRGYWLPVQLRLVDLGQYADAALVIGASSLTAARRKLGTGVVNTWIARRVRRSDLASHITSDASMWQGLTGWLGAPPGQMSEWFRKTLAAARAQMLASPAGLTDFEVYSPSLAPQRPQWFRWTDCRRLPRLPSGLSLCRVTEGHFFGVRRYWLGTIVEREGLRYAVSECGIDSQLARRLQYGWDVFEDAPTRVTLTRGRQHLEVRLTSLLPPEERRLFLALGREVSPIPGRLPSVFRFDQSLEPVIVRHLSELGVRLASP